MPLPPGVSFVGSRADARTLIPMATPKPAALPDRYDPAGTEAEIYRRWRDAAAFGATAAASTRAGGARRPFTLVMPPPNVTAVLHVGHGLNNTVQDVIVRWARMQPGTEALWVPGTDHAGIATQNVIEKQLAAEGMSRFDLGREAFVQRTEAFVAETGGTILEQLAALGCSADWTRTAYTFSPELSRGVREAFVRLFDDGLIYRGHRVIHWCPRCLTSLSDEEAEFQEETGTLYHVALSGERRSGAHPGRRHDAPRDDARRRRPGREPRRRPLPRSRRPLRAAADRRPRHSRHRRRLCRSGLRHRRGEDHAGARRQRLRGRPRATGCRCRW